MATNVYALKTMIFAGKKRAANSTIVTNLRDARAAVAFNGRRASLLARVTGLTAGTATQTTQPLTWSAVSGATDYKVEYKRNADSTWLTFADGVSTTAAATVTGLTASTSYNYRVTALGAKRAVGNVSATVTATTAT